MCNRYHFVGESLFVTVVIATLMRLSLMNFEQSSVRSHILKDEILPVISVSFVNWNILRYLKNKNCISLYLTL